MIKVSRQCFDGAAQAPLQQYADLLTRRLQALQEMRTAERLTVPRSGGRHPQHSGEPDDGIVEEDDGVEEARAPRLLHQRRQPHAPQKPGASQVPLCPYRCLADREYNFFPIYASQKSHAGNSIWILV